MHAIWVFVTDCGDSAVTVPLALLTLVFLLASGLRRHAVFWILAIGGTAAAIGALKLVFGACGQRLTAGGIVSPSGHAAMSAAVYGSLALLVAAGMPARRRGLVYLGTAIAVIGIALSRRVLDNHNLPEIALGLAVGVGGLALFGAALRRQEAPTLPLFWLLLCGAAIIVVMHGTHWMIEPVLRRIVRAWSLAEPWCR